ncbi:MAG: 4-hydroxy-3-methylbut-2-enyl diphosphate reductase [Bacteroidales bacterium]|nr:4-hydroxy-3-methylbut-2-enyl diphosphate reductase [Bacteroidota bacterium]MBL6950574.1 4-hydroxy-3-methylbut-2-enyl diphosphate reductase [Bacteroidales bacterium]
MYVTIDKHSGFCFGVVYAIEVAERELAKTGKLYCLNDIVHNNMEVNRLKEMGLEIIDHEGLKRLSNCNVMISAHGEPPETYEIALKNNVHMIDASCPIVLNLQQEVQYGYEDMMERNGQIIIYGMEGHAEVNGLKGQTNGNAIVVGDEGDLEKIDFHRPVRLYSQTTKSVKGFRKIVDAIEERMKAAKTEGKIDFQWNDSICRQVSNRSNVLQDFAARYDVIIFVSGRKSSNGMILYQICKDVNPNTQLISEKEELQKAWFEGHQTVGICGATSTPRWLMEEVEEEIKQIEPDHASA